MVRNRTYLGEVHFREAWHPSTHPPLVPTELFDAAHALLLERSENVAKRASNSSDYLLTGLIVCERHFTGTAAHGRNGTYRYYTCASRQRSGSDACHAPRLPADALDDAVIEALVHTYERTDVFVEAAANAERRDTSRKRIERELLAVQAELAKSEAAIERYLAAFERGALPESTCGERVRSLGARIVDLRSREADLNGQMEQHPQQAPTPIELAIVREMVLKALRSGSRAQAKVVLQNLVEEIRVDQRDAIHPSFRYPDGGELMTAEAAVRAPSRSVEAKGLEPSNLLTASPATASNWTNYNPRHPV